MITNNAKALKYLNIISLVFIFSLGIFTYQMCVSLINARTDMLHHHDRNIVAISAFQEFFYHLDHINEYIDKDVSLSHFQKEARELDDLLKNVVRSMSGDQLKKIKTNDRDQIFLSQVEADFSDLSTHLEEFTIQGESVKGNQYLLRHDLAEIKRSAIALQSEFFEKFERALKSPDFQVKEKKFLYSLMLLIFCSFVILLINYRTIKRLKCLEQENDLDKKKVIDLECRMTAFDAFKDGVLIMNVRGEIVYINDSLCNIVQLEVNSKDDLLGKTWGRVFTEETYRFIKEEVLPILLEEGHWFGDLTITRKNGTLIYTESSLTRLADGGIVGTVQDSSDKHKVNEEKQELEAQFVQAQKMEAVGRLAGGIAHDFNNILAAMNGYAEFLVDDLDEDSEQYQFAHNILLAGLQARDLVDQLLSFSRREQTEMKCLDLVSSTHEAFAMLKATLPKSVELKHSINIPQAHVLGNATQVSQVIMNLCLNAQDAMEDEKGFLEIAIDAVDVEKIDVCSALKDHLPDIKEPPFLRFDEIDALKTRLILGHLSTEQQYVRINIRDTGCGMSRVIMEHIFEPFFTTKSVDKGTGLGLSTVHGIIISHQACMIIESAIGQGTCFSLHFPLSEDAVIPKTKKLGADYSEGVTPERKTILLVEDQENVRNMIKKMMDRLGYDVFCACSGLDGLDMVRETPEKFDLIVTDHNMPKMTGIEMIEQVHMDLPEIPFIVLSGYSEDKIQEIINGHHAVKAVIRKPVSKGVLSSTVQAVLNIA